MSQCSHHLTYTSVILERPRLTRKRKESLSEGAVWMVPDLWEQRQGVSTETIYLPVSLRAWSFFGLQLCWLAAQSGVRQALTVSHCSQQTAWPRSLTLSSLLTMHMYHALFLSMLRLFFLSFFLEPQLHADLLLHFFFFLFFFFLSFFVTFFFLSFFRCGS